MNSHSLVDVIGPEHDRLIAHLAEKTPVAAVTNFDLDDKSLRKLIFDAGRRSIIDELIKARRNQKE